MKNILLLLGLLSVALLNSCKEEITSYSRINYANSINYGFLPSEPLQRATPMSDLGAWQGIALPQADNPLIGVTGPYLLGEFCWIATSINQLKLEGLPADRQWDYFRPIAYPGLMVIEAGNARIGIRSETVFSSSRTYISKVQITNKSREDLQISPYWQGNIFSPFEFEIQPGGIRVKTPKGLVAVHFDTPEIYDFSLDQDTLYRAGYKQALTLKSGQTHQLVSSVTYMPYHEPLQPEITNIQQALAEPQRVLEENQLRWDTYLNALLRADLPDYDHVAVKSLQTLITNWKTPTGDLRHQGLVPSMAVSYFYGFWAWDSWKHAVAVVAFDAQLAKDQIRTMFDYQDEMGMVADCVFPDPKENNWRDTKPPLAVWAVYEIYKATGDLAFVQELLPKLEAYHHWWYQYRDFDQNAWCEWGSTDGSRIAAKWESGMDNAVRFDEAQMVMTTPYAFSMDQESVDLNAYLVYEKELLARLLECVGDTEQAKAYRKQAGEIKDLFDSVFYNPEQGYYFDVKAGSQQQILVAGPEGWTPLWCELASQEVASQVIQIMLDPQRFNTYIPLPTLDASHPKFAYDGYWRGSIWLDQVYFGISALRKYGKAQEADALTYKVFDHLQGLKGDLPIYENYDAQTGEPLRAPNFSWSAAHLLMLYQELTPSN